MWIPVILAHGSLGSFDELIFVGVAVVFLVVVGISWAWSRMRQPDFDAPQDHASPQQADSGERFKLD